MAELEDWVQKFADAARRDMPPGTVLVMEQENTTLHGEEAFEVLFGWLSPEDQAEYREAIFGPANPLTGPAETK